MYLYHFFSIYILFNIHSFTPALLFLYIHNDVECLCGMQDNAIYFTSNPFLNTNMHFMHQTLSMSIFIFKKEKKWHNDYTFNMYSIYTSLNEGQSYNFKHKCFHLLNHLLTEIITVSRMSWPYFVSGTTRLACKRKNAI